MLNQRGSVDPPLQRRQRWPVFYQLFSRREPYGIQLDARAGSPPTAGIMLCRHAEVGGPDKLDELLREWKV